MYLTPTDKYWAIDIEGDDLPSNRIWCLTAKNVVTKERISLVGANPIREWVDEKLKVDCKFIGHNIIGYDAPTLNRLLGTRLGMADIIDTMILSMIFSPSLTGGHSLESWGIRLKSPKGKHVDFSQFTPEMLAYCEQDTALCCDIYTTLLTRMKRLGFTDMGLELEHRSWYLIQKQQQTGFAFNIAEAHVLYSKLRQEENKLQEKIHEQWPPTLELIRTYKKPYKNDGSPTTNLARHTAEYVRVDVHGQDRYDCFDYVAFNIGSPDQRVEKLLGLGWEPREFTKTGKPKPTDKGRLSPSLEEFVQETDDQGARLIARWIEYNSRANMINTWIEAYNENTKCIHGNLWYANTLRYRHSNPNTANIPAVRVGKVNDIEVPLMGEQGVYTYEARDLWTVRDLTNRVLIGVDAKGIQLRVLAHYLNNKKFTEAVLDGDPHSYNQQVGGFRSRAIAKTFIYAFLLGAGDAKVGQIIGGTTRDGKQIKERFIGNFPGLKQLLDGLERQVQRTGRIRLCDGTPLIVTAMHTRLGYLLQGDESRIMKKAAIITAEQVRRRKLDILKVGDIHDEWQNDALKIHADEFVEDVCPQAFNASGQFFNYRLPIDCDSKVGLTWAETH
jgi:DNA polymerase-1